MPENLGDRVWAKHGLDRERAEALLRSTPEAPTPDVARVKPDDALVKALRARVRADS